MRPRRNTMRIAVIFLLTFHGLLHLPGFLKPWKLAVLPALSGRSAVSLGEVGGKVVGLVWLIAGLLLLGAAALRVCDASSWWMVALVAVVLSQALVVFQWHDAKFGTVANVLLAACVVLAAGTARFHRVNDELRDALFREAGAAAMVPSVVRAEELTKLPTPVRRWMEASGVVGKPRAHTVRLRQRGIMRTAPGGAEMRVRAEQYFRVDEPAFLWFVDVESFGGLIAGRDTFRGARGRMYITLGGLVPVADGQGPTFDQGAALRYLGEIIWFPSAALSPAVHWTPVDDRRARATLAMGRDAVSADFTFDEHGRCVRLEAKRYYAGKTLEDWDIPISAWRTFHGVTVPARGGAVWHLKEGDFSYYDWEIVDVEANVPRGWRETP
ncbi:MAG: DUF6544 family protein [Polyangiales bacterium]